MLELAAFPTRAKADARRGNPLRQSNYDYDGQSDDEEYGRRKP
jgi:hypothetical protein